MIIGVLQDISSTAGTRQAHGDAGAQVDTYIDPLGLKYSGTHNGLCRFQSVDCVTANSARHHHHPHHQLQHLGGSASVRGNSRQLSQAVQCQHAPSPATAAAYRLHFVDLY